MTPAAPDNLDWLFWLLGGFLAFSGLALAAWALFWDRATRRGVVRRRCPRCWYDMAGVPVLQCPECGRTAKSERRLLRTRRRWLTAVLAGALSATGIAAAYWPRVQREGWMTVVPTTVIVAMLPRAGDEYLPDSRGWPWDEDRFAAEMARRLAQGRVAGWQMRWALRRVGLLRTRATWVEGEPLRVGMWAPSWIGSEITARARVSRSHEICHSPFRMTCLVSEDAFRNPERDQTIGAFPSGAERVVFDVHIGSGRGFMGRGGWTWDGQVALPVRIVRVSDDEFLPLAGPAIDAAVRGAIEVGVSTGMYATGRPRAVTILVRRTKIPDLSYLAIGFVADLLRDGQPVRTLRFPAINEGVGGGFPVTWAMAEVPEFDSWTYTTEEMHRWSIRVRGDRAASLREFGCNRYWGGEYVVPLWDAFIR